MEKCILTFLLTVIIWIGSVCPGIYAGKGKHRNRDRERGLIQAECATCDTRRCPSVYMHNCNGHIVKDKCGCCPICTSGLEPTTLQPKVPDDKCSKITCTKGKMCVLNIQNIPICRCPSIFLCRKKRGKNVCGKDGVTYASRCHMRIAECSTQKKVRVAYKGQCVTQPTSEAPRRRKQNRGLHKSKDRESQKQNENYRPKERDPSRQRGREQRQKLQHRNKNKKHRSPTGVQRIRPRQHKNHETGLMRQRDRKQRNRKRLHQN